VVKITLNLAVVATTMLIMALTAIPNVSHKLGRKRSVLQLK
jgi:hypothetical protein